MYSLGVQKKPQSFGRILASFILKNTFNVFMDQFLSDNWAIGLMSKVFAYCLGDWGSIPGRVIPKTQKNGTWCLLA